MVPFRIATFGWKFGRKTSVVGTCAARISDVTRAAVDVSDPIAPRRTSCPVAVEGVSPPTGESIRTATNSAAAPRTSGRMAFIVGATAGPQIYDAVGSRAREPPD